jgi:TPR repeat protein
MRILFIGATLFIATGLFTQAFAAGDYIWEERYNKALPKAEQGNAKSQYAVGEMFEKGKGAVKDLRKAFEWYRKSAKQNNKKAAYKVGRAYLDGKGVSKNPKLAFSWFKKSASKKYSRAEYYLGLLYENGTGVARDYAEAGKWYKRALAGGYGSASEGLARITKAQKSSEQTRRVAVVAVAKPKPIQKPKPASAKKSGPKSTKAKVLAGGWKKGNKSIEYLPSRLARCKDKGKQVECLSAAINRNIGMADINYTTKALLFGFKENGSFQVSYRNNVSDIKVTDPEFAESGGKVPVTLGWQDAEHKLACKFENDRALVCTKNKLRKIKFQR